MSHLHWQRGIGIFGVSSSGIAVLGQSSSGTGVEASSGTGAFIFEGHDNSAFNRRFAVERATGNVLADGAHTGPADFAEMMHVSGTKDYYEPGDVLAIGLTASLLRPTSLIPPVLPASTRPSRALSVTPRSLRMDSTDTRTARTQTESQ